MEIGKTLQPPEWVNSGAVITRGLDLLGLRLPVQFIWQHVAPGDRPRAVELALARADFSAVRELAIDETSRARGHDYITLAADAVERRVLAVAEGRSVETVAVLAEDLKARGCDPAQVSSVSIDMSPAFIKGCGEHLPNARLTFDKFHVVCHASTAVDKMRRIEQRNHRSLRACAGRCSRIGSRLSAEAAADLDAQIARMTTLRTARAWVYKEQLREILERKQINVVRAMLQHWCTCVMRSKVEPMKEVADLVRRHLEGIVAWAQTRQTNGFLEALNGLFQAAKRRARGFTRMSNIRTVIFLIAGKLDFRVINPHASLPTWNSTRPQNYGSDTGTQVTMAVKQGATGFSGLSSLASDIETSASINNCFVRHAFELGGAVPVRNIAINWTDYQRLGRPCDRYRALCS